MPSLGLIMALATTTLSSACAQGDQSIVVASAASIAVGRMILIDQELMQVAQSWVSGTTIPVLRGRDGTAQLAHKVTANVTHGLASDFSTPAPQDMVTYSVADRPVICQSISATSTLTLPPGGTDTRIILNGTSVITLTIPVPTKDMDYNKLTFLSNGVAAHVLSFTGGLGGAGSSYVKWTNNATAPSGFEVYACNGLWLGCTMTPAAGTVTNITGTISA